MKHFLADYGFTISSFCYLDESAVGPPGGRSLLTQLWVPPGRRGSLKARLLQQKHQGAPLTAAVPATSAGLGDLPEERWTAVGACVW